MLAQLSQHRRPNRGIRLMGLDQIEEGFPYQISLSIDFRLHAL
jgi:hypothetical protein